MALQDKPDLTEVWASGGASVKPSDEKIQLGWVAEVPPFQYENWIQNRQDQFLAHINQRGIPVWDGLTDYEGGGLSYAQGSNGVVYKSVAASGPNSVVQDPTTDVGATYWEKAFADNGDNRIVNAVPNTRQITSGTGLSGGGSLAADRVLSVDFATAGQAQELTAGDVAITPETLGIALGDLSQNIVVFDEAGVTDWTVPDVLSNGKRKARVTVIGGGGGGGKQTTVGGGGGGGGGFSESILDLSGELSVTVTVGVGGSGRGVDGPGISGGASSFGGFLSATGGSGGASIASSSQGGASGVGVGGQLNFGLGPGGRSIQITDGPTYSGGHGGGIGGGMGANVSALGPVSPGAGGGGAASGDSSAGNPGIVIVRW